MITDFRLNVFVTVARYLSFTKAAALLNVSQPAISKHIKELEVDFGEALFNRKGNTITLTSKGKEIIPLAERILEDYAVLNDSISCEENAFEGELHIGASTTIAHYILPGILAKFNSLYPRIKLSVISANSDEVITLLKRKEIEIALVESEEVNHSVHYTPFASDKIVLVSTNSLKNSISIEDLSKIPLLIREEGSGTLSVILSALRAKGLSRKSLNIKLQLGSSEAILRYIKSSNDYAFLSVLVVREHIERGELFVNKVEGLSINREFRFVTLHGYSGRLMNLFMDFCSGHYNFQL